MRSLQGRVLEKGKGGRGGGVLVIRSRHIDVDGTISVNGGDADKEFQDASGTFI